jgi:hypothetical protein
LRPDLETIGFLMTTTGVFWPDEFFVQFDNGDLGGELDTEEGSGEGNAEISIVLSLFDVLKIYFLRFQDW